MSLQEDEPSEGKFLATITDGLRHAVRDHGPITKELIGSAAKRVWSRLRNTKYDPFRAQKPLVDALKEIAELEDDAENQQFKLNRFQAAQVARRALNEIARRT